jgi:hypothetical protein
MALRRIKSVRVGRCSVSIHRDAEWNEWRVTVKAPGKHGGTAHEDTKAGARSTAAAEIRRLRRAGVC